MIVIVCAMSEEMQELKNSLVEPCRHDFHGFEFYSGKLEGKEVALCRCGVGKVCAAACVAVAVERFEPEMVINSGVAGGVPPLNQGDVVIVKNAVEHDYYDPTESAVWYDADERAVSLMEKICSDADIPCLTGSIATGDQFIDNPEKASLLHEKYGAVAFDMETAAIMKTCKNMGVRCAVQRAISDNGTDDNMKSFYDFLHEAAARSADVTKKLIKTL